MTPDPIETDVISGQEAPLETEGHTSESIETEGHASLEQVAPTENYEGRYKELQSTYTKETQANKELKETLAQFDGFGGVEGILKSATFLQNDPGFQEWMQNRNTEDQYQSYGVDTQDLDPESKQAMDLVEKMATDIASKQIDEFKKEFQDKFEPIENERAEKNLASIESQMDEAHPDWRELKDQMLELGAELPDNIANSPTVDIVTSLYYRALAMNPEKYEAAMAKAHNTKIEKAKASSMTSPTATHKGASGGAQSVMEAFKMTQG